MVRKEKLEIGMKVVLSDEVDAPQYEVICLDSQYPDSVNLGYFTSAGMFVNSGWYDIDSVLEAL